MAVNSNGYEVVRRKGKNYYTHRLVAAQMLGRELERGEHVHHINGNRLDNRPENLEIVTRRQHAKRHWRKTCQRGHDLTKPENIYIRPDTKTRTCYLCCRLRDKTRDRSRG